MDYVGIKIRASVRISARGRLFNVSMAINRPILAFVYIVHIVHMFILYFCFRFCLLYFLYVCIYIFSSSSFDYHFGE